MNKVKVLKKTQVKLNGNGHMVKNILVPTERSFQKDFQSSGIHCSKDISKVEVKKGFVVSSELVIIRPII